ncbi:hypothetical protein FG91_02728 [Sphingopyxis sp. LC81]|uniref:hypothetical protein n=1 Tax=Sphingopyxis sp. LC81 TaxID=1502850 RepID=UPI00050DF491|nr:hypothetical protein [Sphingopyxis sp. LC81]KGB53482.1 hypothetical protein FG91_02728 [Sphingopyxis sp. LC81]
MNRVRAAAALIATLVLTGCSDSEYGPELTRADVEQLAKEMRVIVGDTPLVFPRVALAGRYEAKPAPAAGAKLDRIELGVGPYGWSDWQPEIRKICPLLARRWVASVCDDPWSPIEQAMPANNFYLMDRDAIGLFDNHMTVGGEFMSNQLRAMRLEVGRTEIQCDVDKRSETRFCTAARPISPQLVAVWTVWDGERETAQAMAEREGKAIATFVRYAIARNEDFGQLLPAMCELRRPEAKEGPNGDPCKR